MSNTFFKEANKIKSGLLFVNHLQQNNPPDLDPAESLKIVQSRSAIYIETYQNFFVLIKKTKSFFNVTAEVAEEPQAVQMLKSYDNDFFGYISSITDPEKQIVNNFYYPNFNLPESDLQKPKIETDIKKNPNAFGTAFDAIITRTVEYSPHDTNKNLSANYFMPVPQAVSNYQERSDIIPMSLDIQDVYEKVFFKAGKYFLTANFISNLMAESLYPVQFDNIKFLNLIIGNAPPDRKVITQHGVQFWIEIYSEG